MNDLKVNRKTAHYTWTDGNRKERYYLIRKSFKDYMEDALRK